MILLTLREERSRLGEKVDKGSSFVTSFLDVFLRDAISMF